MPHLMSESLLPKLNLVANRQIDLIPFRQSREIQFLVLRHEILSSISVEELERVLAAWIDRVRQVTEGNGDYLTR
jgi:hypothetical protein